jgi:hypothetical protein
VKGLGKIWTSREDDWKDAELRLRAERIGCCWVEEELERVDVVEVGLELLTAPTRKKDQVCQLSDRRVREIVSGEDTYALTPRCRCYVSRRTPLPD